MWNWWKKKREARRAQDISDGYLYFASNLVDCIRDRFMGVWELPFQGSFYTIREQRTFDLLRKLEEDYVSIGKHPVDLNRWITEDLTFDDVLNNQETSFSDLNAEMFRNDPEGIVSKAWRTGQDQTRVIYEDGTYEDGN